MLLYNLNYIYVLPPNILVYQQPYKRDLVLYETLLIVYNTFGTQTEDGSVR